MIQSCISNQSIVGIDYDKYKESSKIDLVFDDAGNVKVGYLSNKKSSSDLDVPINCTLLPENSYAKIKPKIAYWIWNSKILSKNSKEVISKIKAKGADIIFMQVGPNLVDYENLVNEAGENNIKVVALNGHSEAIFDASQIIANINDIKKYNLKHRYKYNGYQVDIEPYTLPGYSINEQQYLSMYVKTIKSLRETAGDELQFSVVIPFWFSQKNINGENLAEVVIKSSDYVSTMSYRVKLNEITSITSNTLCLAKRNNKSVFVGLEKLNLKNEYHFEIPSNEIKLLNSGDNKFSIDTQKSTVFAQKKYVVSRDNLSFYSHPKDLDRIINSPLPYSSFMGWAIHGDEIDAPN